jgi:hypothetical protein
MKLAEPVGISSSEQKAKYNIMKLSKLGDAENEQSIKKVIEKRQVFLKNFRNNLPEFCKECHLYIRRKVER